MASGFEAAVCRLIDRHQPQTPSIGRIRPPLTDGRWTHFDFHPLRARVRLSSNGSAMLEISCDTTMEYRYSLPALLDSSRTTSKDAIRGDYIRGRMLCGQFFSHNLTFFSSAGFQAYLNCFIRFHIWLCQL